MVEDVRRLRLKLNAEAFRDAEALQSTEVPVIDGRELESIAASRCTRTVSSSYILRVRIIGSIAHDVVYHVHSRSAAWISAVNRKIASAENIGKGAVGSRISNDTTA
jgi:hypothetical protein